MSKQVKWCGNCRWAGHAGRDGDRCAECDPSNTRRAWEPNLDERIRVLEEKVSRLEMWGARL